MSPYSKTLPAFRLKAMLLRVPVMLRNSWPPLVAAALMLVLLAFTPDHDLTPGFRPPVEIFASTLGHSVNSIWVGISMLLLIVPSLVRTFGHKQRDPWAWRALDAALLDFLFVDVLGKNLFTGLGRPGRADQPGFPSGHATMAWLMAWLVWQRFPKLGPLWFLMAALISWSRVENLAHFPYQVIAGALYGCTFATLTTRRRAGVLLPRILLPDAELQVILNPQISQGNLKK